jgi:hypothetical protein
MASDLGFVEYVCDQMRDAGRVRFRKMFGEFAVYCDDKVVALVCDDQLFVKPTPGGRVRIPPKANTLSAPSRTPVPVKPNTIGAKRRVCSSDADVVFGFWSTGGVWRRSLAQ